VTERREYLCCVDGSERSLQAVRAGLAVLDPAGVPVVLTVVEPADPTLVMGTGMAAGTMSPEAYEAMREARVRDAQQVAADTAEALGRAGVETRVIEGPAGPAICDHARDTGAAAIVIGSRGHGGLRRAILGSVSDHVVRHAPCPVVVTGHPEEAGPG
jgi:nucleotide-binding universal stress UspA family protein